MIQENILRDDDVFYVDIMELQHDALMSESPLSSLRDKSETMIELKFLRLGLKLRNGAKVLNGVTGVCRAGRLTAICGPSGSGKTTLMNTLCGRAT